MARIISQHTHALMPPVGQGPVLPVLLVSSEPDLARTLHLAFASSELRAQLIEAGSLQEACELLRKRAPLLAILVDYPLTREQAGQLAAATREHRDCPLLLLVKRDDASTRAAALRAGALDTVVKSPASLSAMPRIVQRALRHWNQIRENKSAHDLLRLRSRALEAVANAVVITDCEGTITWVNPAFTRLTGYADTDAVGKNTRLLKSGFQCDNCYRELWQAIRAGRVWRGQIVNRRKDGTSYDAELTITPVPDDSGRISHFIGVQQNITDRVRDEARLREYALSLQQANQSLLEARRAADEAREEAERANCVKSKFLACMSHELRTPLNSVLGFTQLMIADKNDPPAPARARRLEKVYSNGRHLLALINDLLDIAKIEADQLALESEPVDMSALITECAEMAKPLLRNPGVVLRDSIDSSIPAAGLLLGDEIRLRQVIMNLLSNAAKFTEAGWVELRSAYERGWVRIEVEDTGMGMANEDLPRIFHEFEQVDSSNSRRAGGTGLGLAICDRLVTMMGGTIQVASQLQIGTHFTIRLPMGPAPSVPARLSISSSGSVPNRELASSQFNGAFTRAPGETT